MPNYVATVKHTSTSKAVTISIPLVKDSEAAVREMLRGAHAFSEDDLYEYSLMEVRGQGKAAAYVVVSEKWPTAKTMKLELVPSNNEYNPYQIKWVSEMYEPSK